MVSQADLELIHNFATELDPFVGTVMVGVQEFRRPTPDTVAVGHAVQALGMIRGAGSILMLDPLVRISDMLSEAFDILQTGNHSEPGQAAIHLEELAGALTTSMEYLVDGKSAAHVVDAAHRSLASLMRALVEEEARTHGTDQLRRLLLHGESPEPVPEHHEEAVGTTPLQFVPDNMEAAQDDDPELRQIFLEEAGDLVAGFRDTSIALVRTPEDRELVDALRRTAHTLKGAANMTGHELVGTVGAAVENLLDAVLERDISPDRDALEMIVVCWKMLPAMLRSIDDLSSFASPVASVERRSRYLISRLERAVEAPRPAGESLPSVNGTEAGSTVRADEVQAGVEEPVETFVDVPQSVTSAEPPALGSWPAAERLREEMPLDSSPIPEPEAETTAAAIDPVRAQDELSRERLGSALLDLAFSTDGKAAQESDAGDNPDQDIYDERREAEFVAEMRRLFAEECADTLALLSRAAIVLERDPSAAAPLREATRALHTLKGGAYAAGEVSIADACHNLETALASDDTGKFSGALFAAIDDIERLLGNAPGMSSAAVPDAGQQEARLRVPAASLDEMLNVVGELVVNRAGFEQRLERFSSALSELLLTANRLQRSGSALEQRSLPALNGTSTPGKESEDWDDLEFDRYTELDRLSRELTEIGADISTTVNELSGLRGDLDSVSSRQRRLTTTLQEQLMDVRMVPLGSIAPRFYRLIRQVAETRQKQVRLIVEGGETTFDATLLEALGESMVHLLRNAVDHGIELPDERRRRGKDAQGTIRVRAFRDGGESVIEIHDDGAGIDTGMLRQRAHERGLPVSANAPDAELFRLIFEPGFSTRDSADEVSGRGVGLDIVESAVSSFKGRVLVDSEPGAGTTIRLRLPVMLSVAQAFMVRAAGEIWAVPIDNIDLVVDRRESPLQQIGGALVLESGDSAIPVLDLGQHLGHAGHSIAADDGWVMVASVAGERRALSVDELEGQQEIVVKPLGRYVRNTPGVLGATILGNGDVALIVDVVRLLQPGSDFQMSDTGHGAVPLESEDSSQGRPVAVVVDDSLSVRKVVGRTLDRNGWTAVLVRDGQEALDAIERQQVAAVITDIEMPRMDGFELINSLKANPDTRSLPVVVLTSRSGQKHRERAIELGAAAYIVKPFQEQQLLQVVEMASGIVTGPRAS